MAQSPKNNMTTQSQKRAIREWLEQGNTLSGLDALKMFGTMKLSTRISELIADGLHVEKIPKTTPSGKRVMTYKIAAL